MTCASGTAIAKCRDRRTRPDEAIGAESCHVDEYARRFSHVEPNTPPTARFTPNAPARALAVDSTHSLCGLVLRSPRCVGITRRRDVCGRSEISGTLRFATRAHGCAVVRWD